MNFSWKRVLSLALAVFMVVGMVPFNALHIHAAENDTQTLPKGEVPAETAGDGLTWVKVGDDTTVGVGGCNKLEHTHSASCYRLSCDHKDGHLSTCYPSSTAYEVCPDKDTHAHSGTASLSDVVEISGTDVSWKTDHPAYPAVYAIYKAAYDEAYANAKIFKESAGKLAGVTAVLGVTVCYTTTAGEEPTCGHEHSALGGECYTKTCLLSEHTHTDACYVATWVHMADVNNNETPDYTEPKYTVKYVSEGEELRSESVLVGLATPTIADPTREHYTFGGWTPAVAETVTADATYTAKWTPVNYTITWVNGDETTTTQVAYGTMPEAPEAVKAPEKDADGNVKTNYVGEWPTINLVDGPATYTATFTPVTAEYTVTFVNYDGTELQSGKVAYGETPAYTGETPVKPADEDGEWVFNGWDPEINTVTKEVTYTAQFTESKYVAEVVGGEKYTDLQEAIDAAKAGDTVKLLNDVKVGAAINLKDITINGNNHTITWADSYAGTLFNVEGNVTVENLTIDGENAFTFYNDTTAVEDGQNWYTRFVNVGDEDKAVNADVIVNAGNLTLSGVTIKNVTIASTGDNGKTANTETGGYYLMYNDDLAIIKSTAGSVALNGASITGNAGMVLNASNTTSTITNSTIDGNMGCGRNGGLIIANNGTMTITGTSIDGNKAMARSATILKAQGTAVVTMEAGTTIDNNKQLGVGSNTSGSMVGVRDTAKFIMNGGSISNNVGGRAGAIASRWATADALIELNAGTISGNTASNDSWSNASIFLRCPATIGEGMNVDGAIVVNASPASLAITGGNFTNYSLTVTDGLTASITGGTFDADPSAYVAENYKATVNEEGTLWTVGEHFDAQIGETKYHTIQEAINAAENGDTILVLNDVTLTEQLWVGKSHGDEKQISIDLQGHTVRQNGSVLIAYRSGTVVNVANGTVYGNGSAAGTLRATYNGKLVLNNQIIVTSKETATAISVEDKGHLEISGDATIIDSKTGILVKKGAASVVITGGLIEGLITVEEGADEVVSITGGTFANDPSKWVDEGYKAVENADGYWTVMKLHTITFVDGETVLDEQALVAGETPVYGGAALSKDYYTVSWTPAITEVTGDATYTLNWVPVNDTNENGVADEEETITVVVNGEGTVTINGKEVTSYLYDSTKGNDIVILAVPVVTSGVSSTYVSAIDVDGTAAELTYVAYAVTHTFAPNGSQTVTVTFETCGFEFNDERLMNYYDGMPGVKNEDVYNTIVKNPPYAVENVTVTYKAREAMSQTVYFSSMGLDNTILTVLNMIGYDSITIDMPALWLDVNVEVEGQVKDSVSLDQAVSQYLTVEKINGLWNTYKAAAEANGGLIFGASAGYAAVEAEINSIIENIKNAAMYYGAHNFGYNATGAETVTEQIKLTYTTDAYHIVGESDITLKDLRAPSFINGENVTVVYRDYTDEDLLAAIGAYVTDENGTVIEGATVTAVDVTDPYTFEGKYVSENAYELTFKFAGNETYKPSEATFTVTVTKAPASINVHSVNVNYGDAYNMNPDVTLGNKYGDPTELTDSLIQFVIGLDVSELDVDGNGVKGLNGKVQLILPAELQSMLDGIIGITGGDTSNGMEMSLSELMSYLDTINDSSLESLNQALNAITSITEAGDLTIVIGGELPTNIGAYLYGAVSTSSNYETAFDVAYIIIKPVATQVYLDWNYTDSNGIFSWELLEHVDLGASAFDDAAFTQKNAEATDVINNLFFGINEDGELVAELYYGAADPEQFENDLGLGAFTQLAFVVDFGNELYYALPIARPVVIVPSVADVELVDADGNVQDVFNTSYDKTAKNLYVTVDGELVECEITYAGVRTNGEVYEPSTEAPVHAGVYTATALYVGRNANGEVVAVGADLAVLVIAPAESTISVTGGTFAYDGEAHGVTVEAPTPDVTLISGGAYVSGDVEEVGVDAFHGNVNVDFPAWLDKALAEHEFKTEGVDTAYLIDFITSYRDDLVAAIPVDELVAQEVVTEDQLNAYIEKLNVYIDKLLAVLAKLPKDVSLTFNDDVAYTEPGAYAYIGIVTDSDYIPSYDTGLVVIEKNINRFDLLDTTVPYNGSEQWNNMVNEFGADYLALVIDRENNTMNILLESDAQYLLNKLADILGVEFDGDVQLSTITEQFNGAELSAAIVELIGELEKLDLSEDVQKALAAIKAELEKMPVDGTVMINGAKPVNAGKYEVYAFSYSEYYKADVSQGILTIAPIYVVVDDVAAEKNCGDEDPDLTANVSYYSYQAAETYDLVNQIWTPMGDPVKVEIDPANLPEGFELNYTVVRAEGKEPGEYAMSVEATVNDTHNFVLEVVEDDVFTINGHFEGEVVVENEVAADCTNDGSYDEVVYCTSCGKELSRETVTVPAKGHTEGEAVVENEVAVTCTNDGSYDTVVYCSVCGAELSRETTVVPAPGHTPGEAVTENEVAVTCTSDGSYDTVVYCTVCGDEVSRETTVVPAPGHTPGETVKENVVAPADGKPGSYDLVVYCSVCGDEISRDTITDYGDYVCWNMQTDVYYDDVCAAMTEAASGETVQMLANDVDGNVLLWAKVGTALDLNGFTVKADYVIFVNGSDVVDNSDSNAGLLIPVNQITLAVDNDQLPLYDEELGGYVFVVAWFQEKLTYDVANDTATFKFVAYIELDKYVKYLGDGASDNNVKVAVRANWTGATNTVEENYVFSDAMVKDVANSGYRLMYVLTFHDYSEYLQYGDISLTATFQSGTYAVVSGNPTVIPGTN